MILTIIIALEALTIIVLLVIIFNLNKKILFFKRQNSLELKGIGGKDLFENITKSKNLYKDLLIEVHPDRFVGEDNLMKKAEIISSKIAEYKSSYRDLIDIARNAVNDFEFSKMFKAKYPEIFEQ